MNRPNESVASALERPPYASAFAVGGLVWALYAATLAPTVAFWDAGDYLTAAHVLGIPHPPGNPVFVFMARAWEILFAWTGLSVAVRINLFSATMSAGAAVCWFLVAHRILAGFTASERRRRIGAAAAVVISATTFTVWNHSNVNEKVYTVSLFTVALLTWLAFRWRDGVENGSSRKVDTKPILLIVFILALSVGNHLMAFLAAPALLLLIARIHPKMLLDRRFYGAAVMIAILGLSAHLYLPIRSAVGPVINEAAPTCESVGSAMVSVVTFGRAGCENLSAALAREQYAKPPVTERLSPLTSQLTNYLQYFDWQWARSLDGRDGYFSLFRLPFTLIFFALAIAGAVEHRRRDRESFAYFGVLLATFSAALVVYMNFEYGFGQAAALGIPFEAGEVRERDYFFIVSFAVWGIWAGIGLAALWLRLSNRLKLRGFPEWRAAPVLGIALLPLALNWSYATRADDHAAADFAYNLLQSVEPYGVLFTNGDNDTLPLWYMQEVEGYRRDVTVVHTAYLQADWYARQMRDLTRPCEETRAWASDPTRIICQRPFEPAAAPDFYVDRAQPLDSILPITDEQIAQVASSAMVLPRTMEFEAGGVRVTLPEDTVLMPSDQFGLAIIRGVAGDRPVHFATSVIAERWGMAGHIARHGLTFKLVAPEESEALISMPRADDFSRAYGAFLDRDRTRRLLWETFRYRDILERRLWPDDSTQNIPGYYLAAHVSLAAGAELVGDRDDAERNLTRAVRWQSLADR